MDLKEIMEFSSNGLFPMVLSAYLVMRVEAKIDKLTEAIIQLQSRQGA